MKPHDLFAHLDEDFAEILEDSFEMLIPQPSHLKWRDLAQIFTYNWSYVDALKPQYLLTHLDEDFAETLEDSYEMLIPQPSYIKWQDIAQICSL